MVGMHRPQTQGCVPIRDPLPLTSLLCYSPHLIRTTLFAALAEDGIGNGIHLVFVLVEFCYISQYSQG